MNGKNGHVFSFDVSDEMHERMRKAAYEQRLSRGELTRQALDAYLSPAPEKSRRVVRKSAVKGRK